MIDSKNIERETMRNINYALKRLIKRNLKTKKQTTISEQILLIKCDGNMLTKKKRLKNRQWNFQKVKTKSMKIMGTEDAVTEAKKKKKK